MEEQLTLHLVFSQEFPITSNNMKGPLEAFKAARLLSPSKLSEMNPEVMAVESLGSFPFLSSLILASKDEFPQYIALAEDVDPSYDPLLLWKRHELNLPN